MSKEEGKIMHSYCPPKRTRKKTLEQDSKCPLHKIFLICPLMSKRAPCRNASSKGCHKLGFISHSNPLKKIRKGPQSKNSPQDKVFPTQIPIWNFLWKGHLNSKPSFLKESLVGTQQSPSWRGSHLTARDMLINVFYKPLKTSITTFVEH